VPFRISSTNRWLALFALSVAAMTSALLLPSVASADASFQVGAGVGDFTPPPFGALADDPADCPPADPGAFTGPRAFSFMEPYNDQDGSGHFDFGEPFVDCNANERWDGNYLGGGSNTPRYYTTVADPVTARAFVVSSPSGTIAVEVLDHEGLFNVYLQRIRAKVAADGYSLDGIFISSTHDESAPDSLGLYGVNDPSGTLPASSSVNAYWNDYLVEKSAQAIEDAYDAMQPATIRFATAEEPSNMRQCWSSYPFVDNMRMPVLQAVDSNGDAIITLGNVSQHAETLGFNSNPDEKTWISADWPHFFRSQLEQRYGGVAIEMAGSVGSVESPQVFSGPISGAPEQFVNAGHPAGCRTIFNANGTTPPLSYNGETRAFGEQLADAVEDALGNAETSVSDQIWGERRDVCMDLTNQLFTAAATIGIFAARPAYTGPNCEVEIPPAPNGSVTGTKLKTQVAAFRIGDGEFISLPGEVFPFTYWRSFLGPGDMPHDQYPLPGWPLPHMDAPYRFFNGLAEDMIGYIFPRGNGIGVPGEDPMNPTGEGDDRFGCGHSDDSEAASSQAADILATPLINILDSYDGAPDPIVTGRYVLPDGSLSRDPLGRPVIKCTGGDDGDADTVYQANGPAIAVFVPAYGVVQPTQWLALDGRPQSTPDRNTRGYIDASGQRIWLDVFPDVTQTPSYVRPKGATPVLVSLVPAFEECTSPNSTHGAPLAAPSCNPPAQESDYLTVGTPDANGKPAGSAGTVRLDTVAGDPGTPADEADALIALNLTDVRNKADLSDYTGELQGELTLRVTDGQNGPSGSDPATSADLPFDFTVPCTATATTAGATCALSTSAEALLPGSVPEGKRSVWELGRVRVLDGGADGLAASGGNTPFAVQGIFVP
jgi:hypothetical protein